MIIHEAIVLAGGLGTRLKDAVPGIPKCMAPVQGRPFIDFVFRYLAAQGVERVVLALGHQAEMIVEHVKSDSAGISIAFSIEKQLLGTGGAVQLALQQTITDHPLIVNGDTLFKADVANAASLHRAKNALCTLTVKPVEDSSRYGTVTIDADQRVTGFAEKTGTAKGLINGGAYILNKPAFCQLNWPERFSFEKDFLQAHYQDQNMYAVVDDGPFIDIGIPADYEKAQLADWLDR